MSSEGPSRRATVAGERLACCQLLALQIAAQEYETVFMKQYNRYLSVKYYG
jgi:hypothetical protein